MRLMLLFVVLILVALMLEEGDTKNGYKRLGKGKGGKIPGSKTPLIAKKGTKMQKGKTRMDYVKKAVKETVKAMAATAGVAGITIGIDALLEDDEYEDKLYEHIYAHEGKVEPKFLLELLDKHQAKHENNTINIIVITGSAVSVLFTGLLGYILKNKIANLMYRISAPISGSPRPSAPLNDFEMGDINIRQG